MDTLRGNFDSSDVSGDAHDYDVTEDEAGHDLPPASIGQDERRMQVRAYNFWAGLLDNRNYPSIEDLDPASFEDFGPYSVLLDFSVGIEDPAVQFLGAELGKECEGVGEIRRLSDVPPRSLLSRITDHYLQILANQAPIGFEAEFVNLQGNTVLYRGILLPFSSDNDTIDFIYGVINWKELASAAAADELLLEIDQALAIDDVADQEVLDADAPATEPIAGWADGPGTEVGDDQDDDQLANNIFANVEPLNFAEESDSDEESDLPNPAFGNYSIYDEDDEEFEEEDEDDAGYSFASLTDHIKAPKSKAPAIDLEDFQLHVDYDSASFDADAGFEHSDAALDAFEEAPIPVAYEPEMPIEPVAPVDADEPLGLEEPFELDSPLVGYGSLESQDAADARLDNTQVEAALPADADLYDCLASARELAQVALTTEDRSRGALYAAVGRAYDFSLAAQESPKQFAELVEDSGLSMQERAPMTPVVKLVFGADYDKTRLTEYAAVLSHAHRAGIERGSLASYLAVAEGGLKGIVQAERRLRAEESGKQVAPLDAPRPAIAKKLRKLDAGSFADIDPEGPEFALVMIRRTEEGDIVVLGEVNDDIPLIERVARKLIG